MTPSALRWVSVVDTSGFAQPVEAFRVLLPEDWIPEGGVFWSPDLHNPEMCVQVQFRALRADGTLGVEFLPHCVWRWSDDPAALLAGADPAGVPWMRPMSAAAFVQDMILPSQRPGAQILGIAGDPAASAARMVRLSAEARDISEVHCDIARVRIGYAVGWQAVEEDILCAVDDLVTFVPPDFASHALTAQDIVGIRFPAGDYPRFASLFDTVLGSVTHNPEWAAAVQRAMDVRQVSQDRAPKGWSQLSG